MWTTTLPGVGVQRYHMGGSAGKVPSSADKHWELKHMACHYVIELTEWFLDGILAGIRLRNPACLLESISYLWTMAAVKVSVWNYKS